MGRPDVDALIALQSRDMPSASCLTFATEAVDVLRSALQSMPSQEMDAEAVSGFASGVGHTSKRKWTAAPPTSVDLIGSFATGTAVGSDVVADVAVEMPTGCFEGKDHLNHRYHVKRAAYLSVVAAHLKSRGIKRLSWVVVHHDARRPALQAEIKVPAGKITVRLLPFPAAGAIDIRKLGPDRSCLRAVSSRSLQDGIQQLPTPKYNMSILQDVLLRSTEQQWHMAVRAVPALPALIRLLRCWARRRALEQQPDGFTGFFWSMFAVYMVQQGNLAASVDLLQGFRAALRALGNPKMFAGGVQLTADTISTMPSPPPKALYQRHFDVVFLDAHGWNNFGAHVSRSQLAEAQHAAKLTLGGLSKATTADEVSNVVSPAHHITDCVADYQYQVSLPVSVDSSLGVADEAPWRSQERNTESIVRRAAGSRATHVHVQRRSIQPVDVKTGISVVDSQWVRIHVRVDATQALRAVDLGPFAEDADAVKAFRAFWGEKSELRRFPDGKIAEAVVWDVPTGERHLILDQLISFALSRHLPAGSSVRSFSGTFDSVTVAPGMRLAQTAAAARACDAATEKLRKQLLNLEGLPLKVVMVQLLGTVSRRTTPFLPHPSWLAGGGLHESNGDPLYCRNMKAVEMLATLESSGKWPSTLMALRKVKAALGVQLALALEKGQGLTCRASEEFIDVLSDGFAFRLRLHCSRDSTTPTSTPGWGSDMDLRLRSAHHDFILALKATAPVLAPVAQVAQRWVAMHMCSGHMSPEAVELCVAAAVSETSNWSSAGSTWVGFLRFLLLISTFDWAGQPLMVATTTELAGAPLRNLQTLFDQGRRQNTAPAMCIIAPFHMDVSFGQQHCPSKPLLHRLVVLARRALADVLAWCEQQRSISSGALVPGFRASLAAYDALLLLREEGMTVEGRLLPLTSVPGQGLCAAGMQLLTAKSRAVLRAPAGTLLRSGGKELRHNVLVDFSPVQSYMQKLQARFGSVALFFYDEYDGRVIGVKWLSDHGGDPFAASIDGVHSTRTICRQVALASGDQTDHRAALADMACLGSGLVADVRDLRTL